MMLKPPPGGAWLEVEGVVARLKAEFARVDVAPGGARDYAESVARSWRQAGQAERADRLEAVKDRGAAIAVVEGEPKVALLLMVLPGVPLMAGFGSDEHLEAIQPLLKRCAAALGYELR